LSSGSKEIFTRQKIFVGNYWLLTRSGEFI
jgi:hypothetical protein